MGKGGAGNAVITQGYQSLGVGTHFSRLGNTKEDAREEKARCWKPQDLWPGLSEQQDWNKEGFL